MKKFLFGLLITLSAFVIASCSLEDFGNRTGGGNYISIATIDKGGSSSPKTPLLPVIYENGLFVSGYSAAMAMGSGADSDKIKITFGTPISASGYTKIIIQFKTGGGFDGGSSISTYYEIGNGSKKVQDWAYGNYAVNTGDSSTITLAGLSEITYITFSNNSGACKDTDIIKILLDNSGGTVPSPLTYYEKGSGWIGGINGSFDFSMRPSSPGEIIFNPAIDISAYSKITFVFDNAGYIDIEIRGEAKDTNGNEANGGWYDDAAGTNGSEFTIPIMSINNIALILLDGKGSSGDACGGIKEIYIEQ